MGPLNKIRQDAIADPKRVVLPETDEPRIIEAINFILDYRLAKLIIIGEDSVKDSISSKNLDDLELVTPEGHPDLKKFINTYYELRKHKGVTPQEAEKTIKENRAVFAAMLVRSGEAHSFVAGASETTPNVVRAALHCLPRDKSIGTVSGAFLMELPKEIDYYGEGGVFVFADCAVNPDPNPEQLASIGIAGANLLEDIHGGIPKVAFLSYSSKGSARGPLVDKVAEAARIAKSKKPELVADGELQVDSAIIPEVARIKCPESDVSGRANVLIFPNLDAGNISYKLIQRLAGARAIGPILLGFTKPCSDLSRGCSSEDIIDVVCAVSVMVQKRKSDSSN